MFTGQVAAGAEPAPGFTLDPVALEQRMDDCLARVVDNAFVLMAWVDFRSGEQRTWRCSSLKHMMEDVRPGNETHDPFVDVDGFMRCADRTVSYRFVRPATDPRYMQHITQFGAGQRSHVVFNPTNGDIATIYTEPVGDNWRVCATWAP